MMLHPTHFFEQKADFLSLQLFLDEAVLMGNHSQSKIPLNSLKVAVAFLPVALGVATKVQYPLQECETY